MLRNGEVSEAGAPPPPVREEGERACGGGVGKRTGGPGTAGSGLGCSKAGARRTGAYAGLFQRRDRVFTSLYRLRVVLFVGGRPREARGSLGLRRAALQSAVQPCRCRHRASAPRDAAAAGAAPAPAPRARRARVRRQAEDTPLRVCRLRQSIHQELPPESPQAHAHRGEALQVLVGGLRVAVRSLGRAHPPLPQAHRCQTVQVPPLRPLLLAQRPPRPPHEAPRLNRFGASVTVPAANTFRTVVVDLRAQYRSTRARGY